MSGVPVERDLQEPEENLPERHESNPNWNVIALFVCTAAVLITWLIASHL